MALSYSQIEGYWIAAGGDPAAASTMAAIAFPESSGDPGSVQQGQPYSTTGWGLWQITPGNSVPSVGVDKTLLDPLTNARAAVAKFNASARAHGNGFLPWTTYTSGKYLRYVQNGVGPVLPDGTGLADTSVQPAGAPGSGVTADPNAGCLIGWSGVNLPLVGNQGSFCLITKAEMRGFTGAILIVAGVALSVTAIVLLVGSLGKPAPTPTPVQVTLTPPVQPESEKSDAEPKSAQTARPRPATPARVPRNKVVQTRPGPGKELPVAARAALVAAV